MSTALEDGLAAAIFAAGIVVTLAWMVEFGRLEGEGTEWGEWLFRGVVGMITLVALAWSIVALWSVTPFLAVLAPAPSVVAAVVVVRLTRRWKRPARRHDR